MAPSNIRCEFLISRIDENSLSEQDILEGKWLTWSRGYPLGQAKPLTGGIEHIYLLGRYDSGKLMTSVATWRH